MAIDGTYLKADANPKSFHTKATLEKGMKCVEKSIAAYYQEMDEQDARDEECAIGSINEEDLEQGAKIEALVERRRDNWTVRHDWLNQYLFESIDRFRNVLRNGFGPTTMNDGAWAWEALPQNRSWPWWPKLSTYEQH